MVVKRRMQIGKIMFVFDGRQAPAQYSSVSRSHFLLPNVVPQDVGTVPRFIYLSNGKNFKMKIAGIPVC
jgi:hypothetical protein